MHIFYLIHPHNMLTKNRKDLTVGFYCQLLVPSMGRCRRSLGTFQFFKLLKSHFIFFRRYTKRGLILEYYFSKFTLSIVSGCALAKGVKIIVNGIKIYERKGI